MEEITDLPETDFETHHIEGWLHGGQRLSVPLVSHIHDNVWQGGCIQGVRLSNDFVGVLSLYPWERYILGPDTERTEVKMYDAGYLPRIEDISLAVRTAINFVQKGKTLIHCQAGINRSGMITALVLNKHYGMPIEEAISLQREKRTEFVLANKHFEEFLLNGGADQVEV